LVEIMHQEKTEKRSPEAAGDLCSDNVLERFFKFKQRNTSLRRDTLAGLTTFMVMSYIIIVNPHILGLSGKGLPFSASLTSTCLVAGVMSILMGLLTNYSYAIAPAMGINAIVAFSLVLGHGLSFKSAMGLIVLEGLAITILVLAGIRNAIFKAIPIELKKAIAIGIGFFILFIGLVDGGIVVVGSETPLTLGAFVGVPIAVTLFGLVTTIIMVVRRWRGAIILGILGSTALAVLLNYIYEEKAFAPGTAIIPGHIFAAPDFSLIGQFDFEAFSKLGIAATLLWTFSLMLGNFFDAMGSIVGVGSQAGYLSRDGNLPQIDRVLLVDSVAAVAGGAVSASSATTYIESGAGVAQGGRTGWVCLIVGVLFLACMWISPLASIVPTNATAPALIIVGFLMMATLTRGEAAEESSEPKAAINFANLDVGIPALLIMTIIPLTYSITNGIGFGFISYAVIALARGRSREVSWVLWITAAAFLIYFLAPLFQAEGWI
jgi:AGZA family xanthine/uracil permease-like MFS transporter